MEAPGGRTYPTFMVQVVLTPWVSYMGWSFVQEDRQMEKACHQLCDESFLTWSDLQHSGLGFHLSHVGRVPRQSDKVFYKFPI